MKLWHGSASTRKSLADLLRQGAASHSDAIVIIKNDEVVGQWYFGKLEAPIEAMSVTKSIAALAIGCLLHDGKLKSLDEPVCDFYPEWKQGRKKLYHSAAASESYFGTAG